MEIHNLEKVLAQHPFMKDWDEEALKLIAGCAKNVTFKEGEFIFKEGGNADLFYILREGHVSVEIPAPVHGPLSIQTLGEGDVLGWSWFVPPYKWHFDARTTAATRAISFDVKCLRKKMEENPKFGYTVLKKFLPVILERLQATRLQLLDFYGEPEQKSKVWNA